MSEGQQRFLSEPEAVLVRPGAEARLACVIQNMGLTSQCRSEVSSGDSDNQSIVRWQKDVKPVGLFSGKYVMAEDSQVTNHNSPSHD